MSQTQSRKTASDTIHEMYLQTVKAIYLVILFSILAGLSWIAYKVYKYFQSNTIQEMGMDLLIVSLPTILIYSIYKQIKRVRQGGKA
jgi:type IV secretory pathway TrbL component